MFDVICGIHDVIYRDHILIDVESELPSCDCEIVWHEVEGVFAHIHFSSNAFQHYSNFLFL